MTEMPTWATKPMTASSASAGSTARTVRVRRERPGGSDTSGMVPG